MAFSFWFPTPIYDAPLLAREPDAFTRSLVEECRPRNRQRVDYEVRAGMIVLFPSWLRHEVTSNATAEERVSVSFNYAWV